VEANDHGLLKNVRLLDMWLLWWTCFCSWGAMTMVNINTDQIYVAIAGRANYRKERSGIYVSVFGIASALGRIMVGALHPRLNAREIPVWYIVPVAPGIMAVGTALFCFVPAPALIVPFFVVGLATGVAWGSIVLVMKRLFTQPGRHYSFLYTAGMLTPIVFSMLMFSQVFEAESKRQGQPTTADCEGRSCILLPMLVTTALNLSSIAVGWLFCRRVDRGSLLAWDKGKGSCLSTQHDSMLLSDE